jgi:hypothetical protein
MPCSTLTEASLTMANIGMSMKSVKMIGAFQLQIILSQKLSFLHQLTKNLTPNKNLENTSSPLELMLFWVWVQMPAKKGQFILPFLFSFSNSLYKIGDCNLNHF